MTIFGTNIPHSSSLLNYLSGFIARSRGDLQRAVTCFAKVFTAPAEFKQLQLIGKYHLGYTYFLLQDHVHSAEYLQQFIDQGTADSLIRKVPNNLRQMPVCQARDSDPMQVCHVISS